jgi:hypothetical protein
LGLPSTTANPFASTRAVEGLGGVKSVPGHTGQIFFSMGAQGSFAGGWIWRSCDNGNTWFDVDATNLENVQGWDFGAPTPGGNGMPAIYYFGYTSTQGWGTYRGDNMPTTCGAGQTVTWTKVGNSYIGGKLTAAAITGFAADKSRYGYWWINATGGTEQGHHN